MSCHKNRVSTHFDKSILKKVLLMLTRSWLSIWLTRFMLNQARILDPGQWSIAPVMNRFLRLILSDLPILMTLRYFKFGREWIHRRIQKGALDPFSARRTWKVSFCPGMSVRLRSWEWSPLTWEPVSSLASPGRVGAQRCIPDRAM